MELIKNEKARNLSFQRRKTSLKKKLDELSTLCGVQALMLVYGPNNKSDKPAEPELWPTNNRRVKVHQLFNKYKNQSRDDRKKRTVNLSHYFQERKRKADSELEKLRKTNAEEAKKTKLEQQIDDLGKEKLREFNSLLDNQIAAAKARFDLVTNNHNHNSNVIVFSQPEVPEKLEKLEKSNSEGCHPQPLSVIYPQEPLVCYPRPIAAIYPQQPPRPRAAIYPQQPLEQQQQQHGLGASFGANLTPNSRAVVLWNNNGCAGACGSNVVYAPLNSVPVYYSPIPSGMVTRNMRASRMCYYYGGQVVQQPMPQYYVQYPRMTRAAAAAAASSYQVRASQTERYY